ncbi:hypothetical protein CV014_00275 [Nostoc sp. CMAA1605]|nr:hypothetical protein [Nostoc sp. CMAA1605]
MNINPHSFRKIVSTLLEVNGQGYWETSEENLDRLHELYQEVEDWIEGISCSAFKLGKPNVCPIFDQQDTSSCLSALIQVYRLMIY